MIAGKFYWFKFLGKECAFRISKDIDGYTVGFVSAKVISGCAKNKKALRLVFWRFALWVIL